MHRRCRELERGHQAVAQQHTRQEQAGRQIAHAHRLTRERQQRALQMPAAFGRHQQHLEDLSRLAWVVQMLDQHRFRTAHQQCTRHCQAIEQRLRLASGEAVQLQLVRAHEVRYGGGLLQQKITDFRRNTAAFLRMPHHRVTQIQCLGIHRLDPRHTRQDRPALGRTAKVTGEHRIAVAQLANRRDSLDQLRYLMRRQHFAGPLTVLGVIGELHGVERPDIHPDPLHRENRGTVAGVTEYHVGLDSEQMRCTFHAVDFRKTIEILAAQYATKRSLYDRPATQLS
ncbi:hypothetical protein D9M73_133180 [compost metagenome]